MNAQEIKRRIAALEGVPPLPSLAREAAACVQDAPSSLVELAALASFEPALVHALIAEANAGGAQPPVSRIEDALVRLGLAGFRAATFRYYLEWLFPLGKGRRLDRTAFRRHASSCAVIADRIAARIDSPRKGEAYVVGLLHDIGKLALDLVCPDGYPKSLDLTHTQGLSRLEVERRELGADHTLAGRWLAQAWGLPERYADVIWLHHHPPGSLDETRYPVDFVDVAALANILAQPQAIGSFGSESPPAQVEEHRKRLGLSREDLREILTEAAADIGRKTEFVSRGPLAAAASAPSDMFPLRRQLARSQALSRIHGELAAAPSRVAILGVAVKALRSVFLIPAGFCFAVDDSEAVLDGLVWRPEVPDPQPMRMNLAAKGPSAGPQEGTLFKLLTAFTPNRPGQTWPGAALTEVLLKHGLVAVPMPAGESSLGQIIFDASASLLRPGEQDMADLLALGAACGAALARRQAQDRQERHNEELATALWKQELARRQSIRAERLSVVGQLAAGAAHEINNPLTAISGRAQLLLSRATAPDDVHALETIIHQSRRVSKILSDLMQFARPSEPKLETTLASFVLHQVAAMLRERLESKGIRIVEEYAQALPRVQLDRRQMEQVFLNLILNAEQAMKDRPGILTLRVRPSRDRRSVVIQISDTGHGIPSHLVDRIFEPFFTTREEMENTGLGLAVCYGIVENHRGAINVHSAVGQGTTFTIMLPVAPPSAAAQPDAMSSRAAVEAPRGAKEDHGKNAPAAEPQKPRPPAILLADRDEDLREVLRESLQSRGYIVRTAADGLEAMAEVIGRPVDLALLEASLTMSGGVSILQAVRDRQPALPIIAFTGMSTGEDLAEINKIGVRACLSKPFEAERLFREIERALASRHVA